MIREPPVGGHTEEKRETICSTDKDKAAKIQGGGLA